MKTTITTIALGSSTVVTLKRYGDGTLEFVETTAAKPAQRSVDQDLPSFLRKLWTALATVA